MNLVTIEQVRGHVLSDTDDDDDTIAGMIAAASSAVLTYLDGGPIGLVVRDEQGRAERDTEGQPIYERDTDGALVLNPVVQQAALVLIAEWYRNRDAEQNGAVPSQYGYGYLPQPVIGLLFPLKRFSV